MPDPEQHEGEGYTPHRLGDLEDVLSTPPADGQTLVWDATQQQWKPGAAGAGHPQLPDITDIADPTVATAEDVSNKLNTLLDELRTAGVML